MYLEEDCSDGLFSITELTYEELENLRAAISVAEFSIPRESNQAILKTLDNFFEEYDYIHN